MDFIIPSAGLKLWLKADTGITKDGSNYINAWNDQSGNGNNAEQATAGQRPLFSSNGSNGRPTVLFDGTNDFLTFGTNNLVENSGFTLLTAFRVSPALSDAAVPFRARSASNGEVILGIGATGNSGFSGKSPYFGYRGSNAMTTAPALYAEDMTKESVLTLSHYEGTDLNNLTKYEFRKNGSDQTLAALSTIPGSSLSNELGRDGDGTKHFNGNLSEILLYSPGLIPGQTTAVEYYLTSRYIDTAAPTVINIIPFDGATGVAASTILTATFSEDMDPATINASIFTLGGVTGVVTFDGPSRTATFTPGTVLSASTTYTATILTGAKDLAGNGLAADFVWTFTTAALSQFNITAQAAGSGGGSISSNPPGIDFAYPSIPLGFTTFDQYSNVSLTANADVGAIVAWDCDGGTAVGNGTSSAVCTFNSLDGDKTVTATFSVNTFTLEVAKTGAGTGNIKSSDNSINCGSDCSELYNYGTIVYLTTTANPGSTFTGWSGEGCSGIGTCTVTMNSNQSVSANFDLLPETVSTPNTPTGVSNGFQGISYAFSTGGSTSNYGHSVQYQFDWGDGIYSEWLPEGTTSASHAWNSPGVKTITVQARCSIDTNVVSSLSSSTDITIAPGVAISANLQLPEGTHTYENLTITNGATLSVAGGSTLNVSGLLWITENATLLLQGKNLSFQVGGEWAGTGVTVNAANVTVDAGSKISADGQGYLGSAFGAGPGGGSINNPYGSGGGYGGKGGDASVTVTGGEPTVHLLLRSIPAPAGVAGISPEAEAGLSVCRSSTP